MLNVVQERCWNILNKLQHLLTVNPSWFIKKLQLCFLVSIRKQFGGFDKFDQISRNESCCIQTHLKDQDFPSFPIICKAHILFGHYSYSEQFKENMWLIMSLLVRLGMGHEKTFNLSTYQQVKSVATLNICA